MEKHRQRFNLNMTRRMTPPGAKPFGQPAMEAAGMVLRGERVTVCDEAEGNWRYRMELWIETHIGGRYSFPVDPVQRWQEGQRIFIVLDRATYRVKLTKPRVWSQRFVYTLEFGNHKLNAVTQGQLERMLAPAPITPLSDLKIIWIGK
jgi:hypothetical protein